MDKISPIKQRILIFIEDQGITKVDFCNRVQMSYSNLKGKSLYSEIGGDMIGEILSAYPRLNSEWLLTGEGEMLKGWTIVTEPPVMSEDDMVEMSREVFNLMKSQQETLQLQQETIKLLSETISQQTKKTSTQEETAT